MGVRTDPGYELFDNDCLACFPPGETPKKIWIYFSGMTWCPQSRARGDPAPPNHGFLCEQTPAAACSWVYDDGHWIVAYDISVGGVPGGSMINLFNMDVIADYFLAGGNPCQTAFTNIFIEADCAIPDANAYGGQCQVFWRPETDSPSIKGIMAKLNIAPHRNTMFEGFPLDATHAVAKYCRKRDATNIKIKFEI